MSSIYGVGSGGSVHKLTDSTNIAPLETSNTATNAYSKGDSLIMADGILYEATTSISVNDTLTVGTNIKVADKITEQIGSLSQTLTNLVGETTVKTLEAEATSLEFDVPTTGNNLIEFFSSDGSNYTEIDTSVSGKVTLTYDAAASARTISCKIEKN